MTTYEILHLILMFLILLAIMALDHSEVIVRLKGGVLP
jgi:hypothetical protein